MLSVLQVAPALNAGGVERTTVEIVEALAAAGHRAVVASSGGLLVPEIERLGGEHVRLPLASKNPMTMRANARRLIKLAQTMKIDLLHARSRAPAWSAYWAAERLDLPFVTTYHGHYAGSTPWKKRYNSIMAKGDVVIANSEFTAQHIRDTHGTDPAVLEIIPRGVDLDRFSLAAVGAPRIEAARKRWGLEPDDARTVIMLPARLTAWKGHASLIDALRETFKRRAELKDQCALVFVGGDEGKSEYRITLEKKARRAGLAELTCFADHMDDMPAAMAAADLVVSSSTRPEAFGRVMAEAQAMARPVIAFAHGGATEIVADGETGFLVPPGDIHKLSQALETALALSHDERARLGDAGRKRVEERFSKANLQSRTLAIYERLVDDARERRAAAAA